MAIKLQLDDAELVAAITAHLVARIPTADASSVSINIVAARQPTGPYAEVEFEFQGASNALTTTTAPVATKRRSTVTKAVEVKAEPESTVTEEDSVPFEADEIVTTSEEDLADDLAHEESSAEDDVETPDPEEEESEEDAPKATGRKKLFGKKA